LQQAPGWGQFAEAHAAPAPWNTPPADEQLAKLMVWHVPSPRQQAPVTAEFGT
jgi:hypothetical protein